jgi:hypothetical protein
MNLSVSETKKMKLFMKNIFTAILLSAGLASFAAENNFRSAPFPGDSDLHFTVTADKKNIRLFWTKDSEENLSHYVVERSTDGKNYTDVAYVFASNIASLKDYRYKDASVYSASCMIYYRLRMVDEHQEISYSTVRVISLEKDPGNLLTTLNPIANEGMILKDKRRSR